MSDQPFVLKDSGARQTFTSGMVRDTSIGKVIWHAVTEGPMLKRWATLLTRGKEKYPDVKPGVGNWTLASGEPEYQRFRESAFRHFMQWYNGERDEDHAAAVFFNVNGAEYVNDKLKKPQTTDAAVNRPYVPTLPGTDMRDLMRTAIRDEIQRQHDEQEPAVPYFETRKRAIAKLVGSVQ